MSELDPIEDPCAAVIPYLPPTEAGREAERSSPPTPPRPDRNRRVLLHGDYWPGNVMWQDGRLVAVIDWEDACLGDPLADLATARVELLCRHGGDAMDQFTDRYLAAHHDTIGPLRLEALPLWELYVSAAALATMGDWGLEPAEEARRRRHTEHFFNRLPEDSADPGRTVADPERYGARENRTQFSVTRRLGFRWALSIAART